MKQIGNYRLEKTIGRGGMSTVYLGIDRRTGGKVAIKVIRMEKQVLQEARVLKELHHPAIPGLIEILKRENQICLVLEYVDGVTLSDYRKKQGRMSEEMVRKIGLELADVLSYLHGRKPALIYRDLKPTNIMLQKDGRIRLIDFGTARSYKEGERSDTSILGTQGYAAPEQYGAGQTDPRSDIFSLGTTLTEMLTGLPPTEDPYLFRYHPLAEKYPGVSKGMEILLNRCMAFDPEKRYQTCRDLIRDLHHPENLTAEGKKKRLLRTGLLALAIALGTITAAGITYKLENRKHQAEQVAFLANQKLDAYLEDGAFDGTENREFLTWWYEEKRTMYPEQTNAGIRELQEVVRRVQEIYHQNFVGDDDSDRSRELRAQYFKGRKGDRRICFYRDRAACLSRREICRDSSMPEPTPVPVTVIQEEDQVEEDWPPSEQIEEKASSAPEQEETAPIRNEESVIDQVEEDDVEENAADVDNSGNLKEEVEILQEQTIEKQEAEEPDIKIQPGILVKKMEGEYLREIPTTIEGQPVEVEWMVVGIPENQQSEIEVSLLRDGQPLQSIGIEMEYLKEESGFLLILSRDNFIKDGIYRVGIKAGKEKAELCFRKDHTSPELYVTEVQKDCVRYFAFDTLGLSSIEVLVDGNLADTIKNLDGAYIYEGELKAEDITGKNLTFMVKDMSGNCIEIRLVKDARKGRILQGAILGGLLACVIVYVILNKMHKKNHCV